MIGRAFLASYLPYRVDPTLSAALAAAPVVLLGLTAGPASASTYSATNVYLGTESSAQTQFLDVSGASQSSGAQVIQWYLNGGANQKWNIQTRPTATRNSSTPTAANA